MHGFKSKCKNFSNVILTESYLFPHPTDVKFRLGTGKKSLRNCTKVVKTYEEPNYYGKLTETKKVINIYDLVIRYLFLQLRNKASKYDEHTLLCKM